MDIMPLLTCRASDFAFGKFENETSNNERSPPSGWFSAVLGFVAFGGIRWGVPMWAGKDNMRQIICKAVVPLTPLALFFFGAFALPPGIIPQEMLAGQAVHME